MSSRELEEAVKILSTKWRKNTNGVMTLRPRCTRCWRGDGEHPETMRTPQTCKLLKLTAEEYFAQLSSDLAAAEGAALCFLRGKEKDNAVELLESHIQKLERRNERRDRSGSRRVLVVDDLVDSVSSMLTLVIGRRAQKRRRRRRRKKKRRGRRGAISRSITEQHS